MKIDPAVQARSNETSAIIDAAQKVTTDAIVAHIAANPDQTESQVCYLVGAEGILNSGLTVLAARPVEQRPGLVLSVESRHNCVRGLFAVAVEEGVIVRSGWSGHGSAVYRVAS